MISSYEHVACQTNEMELTKCLRFFVDGSLGMFTEGDLNPRDVIAALSDGVMPDSALMSLIYLRF